MLHNPIKPTGYHVTNAVNQQYYIRYCWRPSCWRHDHGEWHRNRCSQKHSGNSARHQCGMGGAFRRSRSSSIPWLWIDLLASKCKSTLLSSQCTLGLTASQVVGNRVGNTHIAGLVYIIQTQNQLLQGFVNFIDPASGHFRVTGTFDANAGTTGIDCFLNDPTGRWSAAYTANPLWTIDPVAMPPARLVVPTLANNSSSGQPIHPHPDWFSHVYSSQLY